jgi:uncharacterized membrane protein (DUF4010 family)
MPHLDLPLVPTLASLALALAVGLFVGLERERRGKEAGLRTFGFAALLGGLGGLLGERYALVSLALLGLLTVILNWRSMRADGQIELTTSAALLVTGFAGVLCGLGQTVVPVAVGVGIAALLAWKESMADFTLGMTDAEVRSAILLAILAFVVYPVLPEAPIDPWGIIEPRAAWITVVLVAALGFANYALLKLYGARGVAAAGFLGGMVNSTVTVTELAQRVRETEGRLADAAYRGVLLATAAMATRNALLLGALASPALLAAAAPLALMLLTSAGLALLSPAAPAADGAPHIRLASPFSLVSALKFGLLFLLLQEGGALAQAALGNAGFYAVTVVGGLVSSGSAVASAGALAASGAVPPAIAGTGAVLAAMASALVNLPLVARLSGDRALLWRLGRAIGIVLVAGGLGVAVQPLVQGWLGARLT